MIQKLNPANEPISLSTVATVVTWIGTRYGLGWDDQTATAIATVVFVVGQFAARTLSVPVAKHDRVVRAVKDAAKRG